MPGDSINTALVVREVDGKPTLSKQCIPAPSPGPNQVLVKVSHVAQNPTDVQAFDSNAFGDGEVLGCEFVGEVVKLGSNVTRLANRDNVAGLVWGGEIKGLGAYGRYTLADERISFKVPQCTPCQYACTIPLAATTAWLALFSKNCLNLDRSKARGTSVLIWGGSSSVGLYAIQLASHYGFEVTTTGSTQHVELLHSHGAKHVIDYRRESVDKRIQTVAPNLRHAFDTVGVPGSSGMASRSFREGPGSVCTVRPGKANTENVAEGTRVTDVLVWTAFLKDHSYGGFKWPASQEDHDLGSALFEKIPKWLENDALRPNRPRVLSGLNSVGYGFQEYRDKKISAYKIVYSL